MANDNDYPLPAHCLESEELAKEQKTIIHPRWGLIEFIDLLGLEHTAALTGLRDRPEDEEDPADLTAIASLHRLYSENERFYSRVCDMLRLPNALLFGSDAKGPDYSQGFVRMLAEDERELLSKVLIAQSDKAKEFPVHSLDEWGWECVQRRGVPIEELLCAHSPGIDFAQAHVNEKNNGLMTLFYDPSKVRKLPGYNIQVTSAEAITKIAVYWRTPIRLGL